MHKSDTIQSLIERTDALLYAAKRHGRNRVMCETDPEVTSADAILTLETRAKTSIAKRHCAILAAVYAHFYLHLWNYNMKRALT